MKPSPWLPLLCAAACANGPSSRPSADRNQAAQQQGGLGIPVQYEKLSNGLKVVLSPDHTSPVAVVGVYYGIGFRIEPRDRTGFAHLFEHMMFQGSQNLGKLQFIKLVQSNGGILNGSTRFDFTNYFEVVPSNTVQTMLWAESALFSMMSTRMRGRAAPMTPATAGPCSAARGATTGRRTRNPSALIKSASAGRHTSFT